MGRIALPARTSKPCLLLQNPPRPRRSWLLPPLARREQEASSCPPRSPRPRSPRPRSPRSPRLPSQRPPRSLLPRRLRSRRRRPRSPRRRRSRPRRPPPRRSRSSHSNLIVHHYSFFYLNPKLIMTTPSDLKFKSQRRPTFIINYL